MNSNAERVFSLSDQLEFARLSGDWNPIHLDPIFARRTLAGEMVVHGVHAALWALDGWASQMLSPVSLRALKASFRRPIPVDGMLTTRVACEGHHGSIDILHRGSVAARLDLEWGRGDSNCRPAIAPGVAARALPAERTMQDMAGCSGEFPLQFDASAAAALFPALTSALPPAELASILALSRLVGIECPGLHSLLAELDLVGRAGSSGSSVAYHVTRADTRFGLVQMQVDTPGFTGEVGAFLRRSPTPQTISSTMRDEIRRDEFSGETALVVGGSRGLGELVAKILAAGGAGVTLTYHIGEADAARVVSDIRERGGIADATALDVLGDQPLPDSLRPTSIHYFATPAIFLGSKEQFSDELLAGFRRYYVTGFERLVRRLADRHLERAFYPSTVAIDESPLDMREYVTAKSEGERLCDLLEKRFPGLSVYRPRLPRMATDQTASQLPIRNADPGPVMLAALRTFHALRVARDAGAQR